MGYRRSRRINTPFLNIDKIFPTAQFPVMEAIKIIGAHPDVKKIIVFGSALETRHNPWSDIDLYVEGINRNQVPFRGFTTKRHLDILCDDMMGPGEPIRKEIEKKGVVVYERDSILHGKK